jgi:hypothetical protein
MTFAFVLALLVAAPPLSFGERVEGTRAAEGARYAFVIGATRPFDEAYPRSVFEKKVKREQAEERVLSSQFGIQVTAALLSAEYERIEKETRAPDQWEAIKKALGGSRAETEEVVCRPILVDRVLRARFAFDQKIHAAEHRRARLARDAFLAGSTPTGTKLLRLSRRGKAAAGTDEMLALARVDATGPKILPPAGPEPKEDQPLTPDPEMAKVLEKELRAKGDVTTILEERNRFSVFRLVTSDAGEWLVEAVQVSKRDFDRWLDAAVKVARPRAGRTLQQGSGSPRAPGSTHEQYVWFRR